MPGVMVATMAEMLAGREPVKAGGVGRAATPVAPALAVAEAERVRVRELEA